MTFTKFSRGVCNRNPANIRHGSQWKGLSLNQTDSSFCQFDEMVYGVRALICLLRTYKYKYDCCTLREVIYRFAPPCENNSYSYMVFVLGCLKDYTDDKGLRMDNITSDTPVNKWHNKQSPGAYIYPLCKAICMMESRYELSKSMFDKAVNIL